MPKRQYTPCLALLRVTAYSPSVLDFSRGNRRAICETGVKKVLGLLRPLVLSSTNLIILQEYLVPWFQVIASYIPL